MTEIFCRKSEI